MIGALLLLAAAGAADGEQARAIAFAREGRFVDALLAAEAEPDPARRAEAVLYVRHHAGDLDGALRVAEQARGAGASTPWLEERAAFVALSLREPARARTALDALAARGAALDPELARAADAHRAEVARLETILAARDRGAHGARMTAAGGALLLAGAFLLLGFRAGRAGPSR